MPLSRNCWIDVRDVAQAHVHSLTKEDAGDNRIIVSSTPFVLQDWSTYHPSEFLSYILTDEQSILLVNFTPMLQFLWEISLMIQPISSIPSVLILPRPPVF